MKLVNANLKSIGEAADTILQNKLYTSDGSLIEYLKGTFYITTIRESEELITVLTNWSDFKNWKVEKPHSWEDDAADGEFQLCFVSNKESGLEHKSIMSPKWITVVYNGGINYYDRSGEYWPYAWPVEPKDCWKPEDEQ